MNEEENVSAEQLEQELWNDVRQREGLGRARALATLSRFFWNKGKFKDSLALCQSARDLFLENEPEENIDELIDVNFGIMNNFDMLDRYREAAEAAGAIIDLYREIDHPMLGELLRDQGRYWFSAKEYEKSLECHLEGISIPDPDQTENGHGIDSLNIAMAKKKLGRYQESIADLHSAIVIFKGEGDPEWVSKCHGELAEIYLALEMPEEIEEWSRKALDYAELTGNSRWEYLLNYQIGVARKIKGEIDSAEEFLTKAKFQLIQNGDTDWPSLIRIEKEIAGIDVIRGKVNQANEILRRISTIEETLLAS